MTHEHIAPSTIAGTLSTPPVRNEAIKDYRPGSPERTSLEAELKRQEGEIKQAPMVIGGETVETGNTFEVRSPHNTSLQLAEVHGAGPEHVDRAIRAALDAAHDWAALPWQDRVAVFLRAADLVAGTWRDRINASTILGQSKSVYQSEIDAICEMADFWRFNAHFVERIYAEQPMSAPGMWNYLDYRPLEGFVLALTPFNFTCIGANLSSAPAMMGNVVVWKPSEKQAFSAQYTMELLLEAGLPPGVINLVHGDGAMVSDVAMRHSEFAGLHFTGSTTVFRSIWRKAGENLDNLRSYPRLVGETGGKDFVLAHPSAGVDALVVGLGRGAFEYQGQKCSAPSRAYIPRSLWPQVSEGLKELAESIPQGDVADMSNFMGAVIDETAFNRHKEAVEAAVASGSEVLTGAKFDSSKGWFVAPDRAGHREPAVRHDGPRALRAGADRLRLRRRGVGQDPRCDRRHEPLRADRSRVLGRSVRRPPSDQSPSERGRQLLHQRQADRSGRGPTAVRGLPGVGDQRQGRLDLQPPALDDAEDHQGDLLAPDRLALPPPRLAVRPFFRSRGRYRRRFVPLVR